MCDLRGRRRPACKHALGPVVAHTQFGGARSGGIILAALKAQESPSWDGLAGSVRNC